MKIRKTNQQSPIQHQRLRAPKQNNSALHHPPLPEANRVLQANRTLIAQQAETELPVSFLHQTPRELKFSHLQRRARQELLSLAHEYSSRYLAAPPEPLLQTGDAPLIMSGHQPELFHPGVWYKNFALSTLAQQLNGVAVNLVIDSDLANQNSIRFPDLKSKPARMGSIALDRPSAAIPYELRTIVDLSFFSGFADRIEKQLNLAGIESTSSLTAQKLWPEVLAATASLSPEHKAPKMGEAIAAGRHRLEQNLGLNSIEVPVSLIAASNTFATFAAAIFDNRNQFRAVYNSAIDEYRTVHRIRSQSHPVPRLQKINQWTEVPFWIYSDESPGRQKLFAKTSDTQILLSDLHDHTIEISKPNFVNEFCAFSGQGIFIRPRALMTTMFSRLFLSDILLHGIGGAKYDQLTDAICEQFFGYRLPRFLTLSATMMLPSTVKPITTANITQLRQQRRQLKFHPERFFDVDNSPSVAKQLVAEKQRWTSPEMLPIRTKEKHDTIKQINQQLNQMLAKSDADLADKIAIQQANLRASQIANSREYSFCLFDSQLASQLQSLVDKNFQAQ